MIAKTTELVTCLIEPYRDSMVRISYKNNVVINLAEAERILAADAEASPCAPNPCPRLILYNRTVSFEFPAIKKLSSSQIVTAMAIVHTNASSFPILSTLLNIFQALGITYPIRFFNTEESAMEWLGKYLGAAPTPTENA